jgi:signal transduction histidine kinase
MPIEIKQKKTFRLSTVFAGILLIVLLLQLSGGYFFRVYENELVRQTEGELISQATYISAFYKISLAKNGSLPASYGNPVIVLQKPLDDRYKPLVPSLNLWSETIQLRRPDAVQPKNPPASFEIQTGKILTPILEEAKLGTLSSVRVLNPQGTVIAGTGDIGLSFSGLPEVEKSLHGEYTSVLRQRISSHVRPAITSISRGTDIRVFAAFPIILKDRVVGAVYLSRSPRNILKALYDEKESVFLGGLFVLGLTILIAFLLSYAIGKPLKILNRQALKIASGEKYDENLPTPPIKELALLMQSFEKMSLTLEARSEYIRSFAMHLAHEFKTPLTAIQGAIELMGDHPDDMSQEQRRRFMENITKDSDRLRRLVTRLLELARADVMQPSNERTDVLIALNAIKSKYSPKVILSRPSEAGIAGIGADILETVLVNLVDNSFQHGADMVEIAAALLDGIIELDIVDNGQGISEGNISKIFTPFFTTKREKGGTGLGLVISKSLLKAHGGDISIVPCKTGAHFKVRLQAVVPL